MRCQGRGADGPAERCAIRLSRENKRLQRPKQELLAGRRLCIKGPFPVKVLTQSGDECPQFVGVRLGQRRHELCFEEPLRQNVLILILKTGQNAVQLMPQVLQRSHTPTVSSPRSASGSRRVCARRCFGDWHLPCLPTEPEAWTVLGEQHGKFPYLVQAAAPRLSTQAPHYDRRQRPLSSRQRHGDPASSSPAGSLKKEVFP